MEALDVGTDRLKVLGGWGAEKLGRFKLNGRFFSYSPLSRVVELEALALGVRGKLAMWNALRELRDELPQLHDFDLDGLITRAESQLERLESHRLRAAGEAFS